MEHPHHHDHPEHLIAPPGVSRLVAAGTLDAELGGLLWLLIEGGVPVLVCGSAAEADLGGVADALTESAPRRDLADRPGRKPGSTLRATSLREALDILGGEPFNLSDDERRAIGLVVVLQDGRAVAVHYVRPVERDKEGHLQHRPPAVLATWDPQGATFEHFAWGMSPELADRVGLTRAEFDDRQRERAHLLSHVAPSHVH